MTSSDHTRPVRPAPFGGWVDGLIGMMIFSASLPATRVAVLGFDPLFVTVARAAIAAVLAIGLLRFVRAPWPRRSDLAGLATVAGGVVVGFPLFTALALRHVTSAHAIVFVGLLPVSTALFAVLRAGERPPAAFWGFAVAGGALVGGYALAAGGVDLAGDALMVAAIVVCGLGYAEGGRLSRRMGGLAVIGWALVLSLPLSAPLAVMLAPHSVAGVGWPAVAGLAYVSVFSMLVGFVFWYRGLAHGGVAAVGQLQLVQPFLALVLAATLLGEAVRPAMLLVLAGVVACVIGARRFAAAPSPRSPSSATQLEAEEVLP